MQADICRKFELSVYFLLTSTLSIIISIGISLTIAKIVNRNKYLALLLFGKKIVC